MANWSDLKAAVASIVKTNGNKEITGQLLQNVLNNIISNLGLNSTFAGIATPETNPGTPDGNVYYLSAQDGIYPNFNSILIKEGEVVVLEWKNGVWSKKNINGLTTRNEVVTGVINSEKVYASKSITNNGISPSPAFGFMSETYLPKDTFCKIHFTFTKPIIQISFYNVVNPTNLNGGYETFFEGKKDIQGFEYDYFFKTKIDGYLMFNSTVLSENVGGILKAELYVDKSLVLSKEMNDHYEELKSDIAPLKTSHKVLSFGETRNVQQLLGQSEVSSWASVIHGAVVQDVQTLYVIKGSEGEATNQLVFNLYEGIGLSAEDCFVKTIVDTIIISKDSYNAAKKGDMLKLNLSSKIDFEYDKYYTLEVHIGEQPNIRLGACDARNSFNLIQASYYRVHNGTDWYIVNVGGVGNLRNYGLLWGVYLGEEDCVNSDKEYQSKLHMNILAATSKAIENEKQERENLKKEITPSQPAFISSYEYTASKNKVESDNLSDYVLEFKFTDFYFQKGHYYKLLFTSDDITKVKQFSVYNDVKKNGFTDGYISLLSPETIKLPTDDVEIYYKAEYDGYLMYNMKVSFGHNLNVAVFEMKQRVDIKRIEEATIKGGNETKEDADAYKNIVFYYGTQKMYANKTYRIRLSQVKSASSYLKSFSIYGVYKQGSTEEGYDTIKEYHDASVLENQTMIEYTPKKDCYLMCNTYATTNKNITVILYDEVEEDSIDNLNNKIKQKQDTLSVKNQAKTVVANSVGTFPFVKSKFSDLYLTLSGDSIFAFQNVYNNDKLGVSAVPPTCDRTANANKLWNALKWGNAIYRRFDYGKASLLSEYDNSFTDDSKAAVKETGTFKTEYIGAAMRETLGNSTTNYQTTTKVDLGSFPFQFDNSEDTWWQRNIPKRFSNTANASIQFTIPAGYSKFDFLFHAHIYGDKVTITTNRNAGVVKVNSKPNDWSNAIDAKGCVKDLSMENYTDGTGRSGGNDSYGIPNMRLYFQITDTSADTVITITKTSDTLKYLIYWGFTYWGTANVPYALHINNMAVGGYGQANIYALRKSMFKYIHADAVIMEMCYNNLSSNNFSGTISGMENNMRLLKKFFEELGLNVPNEVGIWIPHTGVSPYTNHEEITNMNHSAAERVAIELGYNLIANVKKVMEDVNDVYYPEKSRAEFMQFAGGDGAHLGQNGHDIYQAVWESLR